MKKVLDFIKKIFTIVKDWIVANGVEGVLGLIAGLILWAFGYKIYAGFAFGVLMLKHADDEFGEKFDAKITKSSLGK